MAGGLIGRVWAEIGGDASGLKRAAKEAQAELNKISENAMKGSDVINSSFGDSIVTVAAFGAEMVAAGAAMKKAWDIGAQGAQISFLEMASRRLALGYGVNMDLIVDAAKKASFNTITEYDAMLAANAALTMGVKTDTEVIANLMQIAAERARLYGLTTAEAFNRILTGIGRTSPRYLYELGFNIKGITDKEQLLTEVRKQGNEELEKQGGLLYDTASGFQMIGTGFKDLYQGAKMGIGGFIGQFVDLGVALGGFRDGAKEGVVSGMSFIKMAAEAMTTDKTWADVVNELNQRMAKTNVESEKFAYIGKGGQLGARISPKVDFISTALEVALQGRLTDIQNRYNEAIIDAGKNKKKLTVINKELKESIEDQIYALMSANLDLTKYGQIAFELAIAFGKTTESEFNTTKGIEGLQNAIDTGLIKTYAELEPYLKRVLEYNELMMKGGKANYSVFYDIWTIQHGNPYGINAPISGLINQGMQPPSGYIPGVGWEGKHGGSFIGMAGGGNMMIPPGFSNDGYPLMVSSGERVDITPAGNKTVRGEESTSILIKNYGPVHYHWPKDDKGASFLDQLRG